MPGFPHIVVVDDDEAIVDILSYSLRKKFPDGKITGFHSPIEALQWLKGESPDLVLTDLNMPQVDGRQLIEHVQMKPNRIPVFVISGAFTLSELREMESQYSHVRVFAKPLLTRELIQAIEEVLGNREINEGSKLLGLDLLNLLQLINLQRKTARIDISHESGNGFVVIREGELIRAEFGGNSGDAAFFKVLALSNPKIKMLPEVGVSDKPELSAFSMLLKEFVRRRDESR
ncbi:MAG: response regulator [Candidatus Methylacidiphilales bacterium]